MLFGGSMDYFTEAFNKMSEEEKELVFKTAILYTDSKKASEIRNEYYKKTIKSFGKNVSIGVGVKFINPQLITIEDNVVIGDDCTIIAREGTHVILRSGVRLCERVYLDTQCEGGYIEIGSSAYLGTGTTIHGHRGVEIGDHALIAQNVTLTPYSHIFSDRDKNIITQGGNMKKVVIGRDSYIGMGVCVMYSGDIGEGSVIGAGSVVVKPIPPYSVAVGCPAKVIKGR